MNYEETLQYLSELGKFGSHLGLERIQGLLVELNHPERRFKTIHITGTNGKGSVAAFLSTILLSAGLKVGTYTSPHFVKYNERITNKAGEQSLFLPIFHQLREDKDIADVSAMIK